jgi:hypothetical protein
LFIVSEHIVPARNTLFAILVVGWLAAFMFLMPNVMLSDAGTTSAIVKANIGVIACFAFAIGGIMGAIMGSWKWLLGGLILQGIALFAPF